MRGMLMTDTETMTIQLESEPVIETELPIKRWSF